MPILFAFWSSLFGSLLMTPEEAPQPLSYEEWSEEEKALIAPILDSFLSTGLSLSHKGEIFNIPAQSKDLLFEKENDEFKMELSTEFTDYAINTLKAEIEVESSDLTLLSADPTQVSKAVMVGQIENGLAVQESLLRATLFKAIRENDFEIEVPTQVIPGGIINSTGVDLGPLEELAEGKSTFWGSSPEREFNIRKALNEKFNGILIPPGAEFSYVEWLGPIEWGGWKQAYTIFQGTKLEKAPAGGVCQVSTTVYRAALDAGLKLTEQRPHSLYVIYYNEYGDGLDATVFPGEQDLKFVNNTPHYLLMTATEEGYYEAVVRFYGEDDGRDTVLIGPYTASNQTEETESALSTLGIGNMAWKYLLTHADGKTEESWILNSYMSPVLQHREEATELDTDALPIKTGP